MEAIMEVGVTGDELTTTTTGITVIKTLIERTLEGSVELY